MVLSIIIPVYNEARTIHFILDKIKHVQFKANVEK
jgi:glycosyltransferase involved in cell wall biosynthesis